MSPWPPSTKAVTSSTETLNSSARNQRNRAESSTPAMPTTLLAGRPDRTLHHPHHDVERVGDHDDEGVGRVLLDRVGDGGHHLDVDADQIVAGHAGLTRHAGGDDDHVGPGHRRVIVGAGHERVEPGDRRGFGDIQGLPLRNPFRDIEQDDVAQFLKPGEQCERAADLTGAHERDLVACHTEFPLLRPPSGSAAVRKTSAGVVPPPPQTFKRWRPNPISAAKPDLNRGL